MIPAIGVAWPIAEPLLSDRDRRAESLAGYLAGTPFVYKADENRTPGAAQPKIPAGRRTRPEHGDRGRCRYVARFIRVVRVGCEVRVL